MYWQLAVRLHDKLATYATPRDAAEPQSDDVTSRFVSLFLLAALLVPLFVFEFLYTGYPEAASRIAISGAVMLSALWIYKLTGNLALARDVFLGSLYAFLVWEAIYFGSVYSPGSLWLVSIPVVSVLLGSARAGFVWLLLILATAVMSFKWSDTSRFAEQIASGDFDHLYIASASCLLIAIYLFVLMVEVSREKTHSRLEKANQAIKDISELDDLTGLRNRRGFNQALSRLSQSSGSVEASLLVADIDGFKEVNDSYGHAVGDTLIKVLADRLKGLSERHGAHVSRLGGDEFAISVVGANALQVGKILASEILDLLREPLAVDGRSAGVGMSIGLAASENWLDPFELLRQADVAMYEAKRRGKSQQCTYNPTLDEKRVTRVSLARELSTAIERKHIDVYYQPIVDAKTGQVTAVEALARWKKSNGQSVAPEFFISVAEEAGLIDKLGLLVLRAACHQATRWAGMRLAVNLSPVQFRSPTLLDDIFHALEESGLAPENLELEVTEGYLIEHKDVAHPLLEALRSAGIKIALDDFGTGYSSIGHLRQYRFDRLKIDKSLVSGLATDPSARGIIQAAGILAQSLSLDLTAEGVENEQQAQLLRLAGCGSLQGYYFGRPQPAEMLSKQISSGVDSQLLAHSLITKATGRKR